MEEIAEPKLRDSFCNYQLAAINFTHYCTIFICMILRKLQLSEIHELQTLGTNCLKNMEDNPMDHCPRMAL